MAQQKVVEQARTELEQRRNHLDEDLRSFRATGFDQAPPYPLSLLDRLRDELEAEQARATATEAALSARAEAVEKARSAYNDKERARRLAKEAVVTSTDPGVLSRLKEAMLLAELESKLAGETLTTLESELANEKLAEGIQQQLSVLLHEKIAQVSESVQFLKSELQLRFAELRELELEINRAIQSVELNQKYDEDRWAEARKRFDSATDNRSIIGEEVEMWRLARQHGQEELAILNKRLQRIAEMRTAWTRRFSVLSEQPTGEELSLWQEETEAILDQLQRDAALRKSQADQVRKDLATTGTKSENANGGAPELSRWVHQQRKHLEELAKAYDSAILSIESSERLHRRLLGDLRQDAAHFSLAEWFRTVWRFLQSAWDYELVAVDDKPITIGKLLGGMLLFFVGFWLSRLLSRLLEVRLRIRGKVNRDAAAILKTLTFYTLLAVFTLFVLRMVNLPLTAFTFVGGALAIGLGLGSQGLVNNFLSGIVIMVERPLRLGERIVYGGHDGIVEDVGYRCTKVRTLAGHLVTIPNSTILNEAVENIGRRPYVRRLFNVTVTYDTPRGKMEEAIQILRGILSEDGIGQRIHPVIAGEDYPPRVYFNELNADSLNILVVYWFAPPDYWDYFEHAQKVNLRIIEEFEKAGIDFAFPTQTLHLAGDPKRELSMRLLDGETRSTAE
ncbi:MAG: mechanosensitive ion channel [Pirellulales bacterium]|nr:mechanosensitive ion channel [Pirellulales bacterium]